MNKGGILKLVSCHSTLLEDGLTLSAIENVYYIHFEASLD
jgi:hypothetical protein